MHWKFIPRILDLIKIWCGIRKNAILTALRVAGLPKILQEMPDFFCFSIRNAGDVHDPNKRSSGKSESAR